MPEEKEVVVEPKSVVVANGNGSVAATFSVQDGITDDLARFTDSLTYGSAMPASDMLLTGLSAVSAAFIGVHMLRFFGARTELGDAVGAVAGLVLLDFLGKNMVKAKAKNNA